MSDVTSCLTGTDATAKQPRPVDDDPCRDRDAGLACSRCEHKACGWCDECHPEVPEWTT